MRIAFRVRNSGGVMLAMKMAGRFIEIPASTNYDPLVELGLCATEIVSGADFAHADFIREPDGFRLLLNRTGAGQLLEARLIWCDDLMMADAPSHTEEVAEDTILVRDFGLNILEIFESVSRRCTPEDYRKKTFGCSFPTRIQSRLFERLGIKPGTGNPIDLPGPSETAILWQSREPLITKTVPTGISDLAGWQHAERTFVERTSDPVERYLLLAIQEGRSIEFTYHGRSETSVRRAKPLFLFTAQGFPGTYVQAFCEERQAERYFAVKRMWILGISPTRQPRLMSG